MNWRARIERAQTRHAKALEALLAAEFRRLAFACNPKDPQRAVDQHRSRLALILGTHKRAAAATFGWLARDMLSPTHNIVGTKADAPREPTRSERVAAVLVELAKTVAKGALAQAIAEALMRNRLLVYHVDLMLLTAPDPAPAAVAALLIQDQRVAAAVGLAHAEAAGIAPSLDELQAQMAEDARATRAPASPQTGTQIAPSPRSEPSAEAGQRGSGGGSKPPAPPPSPPTGRGPTPRRSRFSQLVERLVREEAPIRARIIARTSGHIIANVLGEAAAGGWSEERTAKALETTLTSELTRQRARVIARTEIGSAQNAATLAIARDRAAAGEVIEKVWIALDDTRTRPTHHDADDQVQPLEAPFQVGQVRLMHPGDPNGPKREIISCRCSMLIRYRQSAALAVQ